MQWLGRQYLRKSTNLNFAINSLVSLPCHQTSNCVRMIDFTMARNIVAELGFNISISTEPLDWSTTSQLDHTVVEERHLSNIRHPNINMDQYIFATKIQLLISVSRSTRAFTSLFPYRIKRSKHCISNWFFCCFVSHTKNNLTAQMHVNSVRN